jgi:signal transduction histidine kinase
MISDKNMFRNILYNLISNAIKYSDDGKPIRMSLEKQKDVLYIEVSDEGIGIPPEDQSRGQDCD